MSGSDLPAMPRRILGIDPGLTVSGWAVVDGDGNLASAVDFGTIKTSSKDPRSARLGQVASRVRDLIRHFGPAELALEQHFVAVNVRSAMVIGEARAAAMVAAADCRIPVLEYSPTSVKEAVTGWGGAPKEQVRQMVTVQLGLAEEPSPLDISDAMAIALTRLAELRLEQALARS